MADQGPDLVGAEVEARVRSSLICRQTDKESCVWISTVLDNGDPIIKVESRRALRIFTRGAAWGVVKLDPDIIKDSIFDGVTKLCIRDLALRCT